MRRVILESPFAGDRDLHERYLHAALADSLGRGEAPFASHAIYTLPGVLDDREPAQRALGIAAGFAWRDAAEATVVYVDLGITFGMRCGIDDATFKRQTIEYRQLPDWELYGGERR